MNLYKEKAKRVLLEKMAYEYYKSLEICCRKTVNRDQDNAYRFAYFVKRKRSKKKYCIFRFQLPDYMTFAAGIQYIFAYEYARSKGFIPVIDMEWEYCFHQYELGKDNAWEYCFNQPVSVEEALKKDYVLVETLGMPGTWLDQMCLDINGRKGDHWIHATQNNWREYYAKVNQYIQKSWTFKPELINEYQTKYGCKIEEGDRVLGVALRESFSSDAYNKMQAEAKKVFSEHPMCPGITETLELVHEHMKTWKCNKIFLSTMFQESLELFLQEFGDSVIYVDRDRNSLNDYKTKPDDWAMNNKEIYEYHQKNSDIRNMTVTYTEEIIGLSKCDYLIAAKSSGSIAALAMNGGKYKDIYILPDKNNIERY